MHEQDPPPLEASSPGLRASRAAPPGAARRAGLDWSRPARALEVRCTFISSRASSEGAEQFDMTPAGPDGEFVSPAHREQGREDTTACPGCGLVLPCHAGPTHAYMGASPACLKLYGR